MERFLHSLGLTTKDSSQPDSSLPCSSMRVTVTPRWNNALIYQAPDTGQWKTSLLSWCHSKSPAPSWEQKPVSVLNMARLPSHIKRSATGVSKRLFIHFSEFTRAGRKTKNSYGKKFHHILSELCVMGEILLLLNSPRVLSLNSSYHGSRNQGKPD